MARDINVGLGVLHIDVLQARIRRARRTILRIVWLVIAGLVLSIGGVLLAQQLRGQGTIVLATVASDTTVTLDGQTMQTTHIVALGGSHTLTLSRPGYYPAELAIMVTREQTTTVTVPELRPRPRVQPIPLPAPGARWQTAARDAAGGWRLGAQLADVHATPAPANRQDHPSLRTLLRLDDHGLTRLSALEAYRAADEQITAEGRFWAAWEPNRVGVRSDVGFLTITTPHVSTVITTESAISGLWWAPSGRWLLIAETRGIGQDLRLWTEQTHQSPAPLVTIPGVIAAIHWSPNGQAAVILSQQLQSIDATRGTTTSAQDETWDATLVVGGIPGAEAQAVRLSPPPMNSLGLVPLAWTNMALFWTAQLGQERVLERMSLAAPLPTRLGILPTSTIALRVTADEQIQTLIRDPSGRLGLEVWPAGQRLFTLDEIPAAATFGGIWDEQTLMLAAGQTNLWVLAFRAEALQ